MADERSLRIAVLAAPVSAALLLAAATTTGCGGHSAVGFDGDAGGAADAHATVPDGDPADGGGTTTTGAKDASYNACPENAPFHPYRYAAVAVQPGVCDGPSVDAFLAACGDHGNSHDCQAWIGLNTGAAGFGTPCGDCILAFDDTGASFHTQNEFFGPNYGACIQLLDPENPACAQSYDSMIDCDGLECDDCLLPVPYRTCASEANAPDAGICGPYAAGMRAACATDLADGGVLARCKPADGTDARDPDWKVVIDLVCGSGKGAG